LDNLLVEMHRILTSERALANPAAGLSSLHPSKVKANRSLPQIQAIQLISKLKKAVHLLSHLCQAIHTHSPLFAQQCS
jgi:hypothetical protein